MNIKNYIHKFVIDGNEIEIEINCTNGYWESRCIKGITGTSSMLGGNYLSLDDYISKVESTHIYSYNFFNRGYKYAKANA